MKRIFIIALVLVAGAFCVFASDYYIKNYEVYVTIGNDGVHHVEEIISVFFEGRHHGIVREIPLDYSSYNGTHARIYNLTCSEEYEHDTDNGYYIMKIGSGSRYVEGDVSYIIKYDYDLGADYNEGYDEFYFNLIGVDWECPINNVHFEVDIPFVENAGFANDEAFFDYVAENTYFTSGSYGSKGSDGHAFLSLLNDGYLGIDGTVKDLGPYEGVTIRMDLPEGWYHGAREKWDNRGLANKVHLVLPLVLILLGIFLWFRFGRDNTPIIVARFEPPRDFSPLMLGYISDGTVDDKDLISMLFYWADQGLLSIEEKKGRKYEFTKLKNIEDFAIEKGRNIPTFETKLFNGFFKKCAVGDVVTFKNLQKNNFFETMVEAKADTKAYFSKDRALKDSKSTTFAGLLKFLSLLPLVTGCLRLGWCEDFPAWMILLVPMSVLLFAFNLASFSSLFKKWHLRKSNVWACIWRAVPTIFVFLIFTSVETDVFDSLGLYQNLLAVVGSAVVAFFGCIVDRRSEYGDKILEETLGYREFIDKVEIDQLKMMIDQDPDFYYHVLSYAIVLGLEDKWAKKFDGMIVNPPHWYSGYDMFDVYLMSRLASNMIRTIPASSIPAHSGSRSGGGGFHSSGFSGGGFGGGGGHAW